LGPFLHFLGFLGQKSGFTGNRASSEEGPKSLI
jgi:hypothetical protein